MANDEMLATLSPRPPVIGIGASAGGVEAVSALLELLPAHTGAAFVVIMHLAPEVRSELTHILAAHTKMPVVGVTAQMPRQPNHVYVVLPDRQLEISDREISAIPFDEPRGRRARIDSFFRSLAAQHGDGFAVILTGA